LKRLSLLAAFAACDLGISFVVQAFVLVTIGIGSQTDAHYAGQAAPVVILAILQLPVQRAIIVAFARRQDERFPALRVIAIVASLAAACVLSLWCVGPALMKLLYPEFAQSTRDLGLRVLHAQSIAILFSIVNLVLLSLNQIRDRFVQCEITALTSTIISAIFIFVSIHQVGVLAAAYGQILKAVFTTAVFMWMLRHSMSAGPAPWKEIVAVVKPLASAGLFTKLAPVIDRSIASGAASGSMSIFVFAQTIYTAATGIAERAIVAPRLPGLRRESDPRSVMRVVGLLALAGVALVLLLVAGTAVVRHIPALARLVGDERLDLLMVTVIALAGLPIAALTLQWTAAAVVVLGRPDLSAKISLGFIVGIAIKYAGFRIAGITGLAIGVSIYFLLNALAFLWALRRIMRAKSQSAPAPDSLDES
jgi:peptidoglycan biosynthesis protein MviN/MurJ (putative lipid II flippase)